MRVVGIREKKVTVLDQEHSQELLAQRERGNPKINSRQSVDGMGKRVIAQATG